MHAAAVNIVRNLGHTEYPLTSWFQENPDTITCDWASLRTQLLMQWRHLTASDLDKTRRSRHDIAMLVQRKYGVSALLVENYLANLERTLPGLTA